MVSVASTQLRYYSLKVAIDNMQMTCSNTMLFMGTDIWILYNCHEILFYWFFFPNHLKLKTILSLQATQKQAEAGFELSHRLPSLY